MIKRIHFIALLLPLLFSCNTNKEKDKLVNDLQDTHLTEKTTGKLVDSLTARGFETFPYKDEKTGDTIVMQKYFIAFLNRGGERDQPKEVADSLGTFRKDV
jgi:hypothetical protein